LHVPYRPVTAFVLRRLSFVLRRPSVVDRHARSLEVILRVLIIGAGAVGSFVGARLALTGHAVTLVGRPGLIAAVRGGGLTLIEPSGSRHTALVCAADSIAAAFTASTSASTSSYDLALVTVKAYGTAGVIAELRAMGGVRLPPLLTLQNGVGNEEALAEAFGVDGVIAGAIDTPVSIPAAGQVRVHRERFKAGVAPVGPGAPVAAAENLLRDAGLAVDRFADYRRLKWSKLLMNLLANAQCAILDWTPAQVMADPSASRMEALAWQEAYAAMAALGIRPVAMAGYPLPLLAPFVRRLPATWLARGLKGFVSGGRGSKMPSLQVALAGGQRSEVSWLNGAVAKFGAEAGVPTPVNRTLASILMRLSDGEARREDWRGRPAAVAALIEKAQA
jgi:2-dehydropantoate 2-reductase